MLRDFRNLREVELQPAPGKMTVVTGENGAGKTSLLEAVGYCSALRSFRGSPREALVRNGCAEAWIHLELTEGTRRSSIEVGIPVEGRDRVQLNGRRPARSEELLEALRVTVFTPDDLVLVKGPPEGRRDYLDLVLQSARPRLGALRRMLDRVLRQRNALLRQAGGRATAEILATLDVWDAQLAETGEALTGARAELAGELEPYAASAFSRLTGVERPLELRYRRSFPGSLSTALAGARAEDLRRAVSTVGPHRDELLVSVDGLDARTRLSQGRQRCMTLALRLAAHRIVADRVGSRPVLLLDDAFSELDERTAEALLGELPTGQAILTTAGALPAGAEAASTRRLQGGALR